MLARFRDAEIFEKPMSEPVEKPEQPEKEKKMVSKLNLNCRMYENVYPEQETCVMVNVRQVTDVGTYVTLLEYNDIEGAGF